MTAPKKVLIEIAKEAGLLPQLKRIWRDHPLLEQISERVAEFIGPHPVDEAGKPLLNKGLVEAIFAFEKARKNPEGELSAEHAYTRQIITAATEVFCQDVIVETPAGKVRWMPLDETASDFMKRYPDTDVMVGRRAWDLSPRMAICCVVCKTVPHRLLDTIASPTIFDELCENT